MNQVSFPTDQRLRVVCNLEIFNESWVPYLEKSEFVKLDRGGYFLSLTVSGYHIMTISKSFGRSKRPISGFRHPDCPEAPTSGRNLGLKTSPIETPLKVTLTLQKL